MSQEELVEVGDKVFIALGGNAPSHFGQPAETIKEALGLLRYTFGYVQVSQFYKTPAFPAGSGPDFVNAACVLQSALPAQAILAALHKVEADLGRERTLRWGNRTLDLDLIAINGSILPSRDRHAYWRTLPIEDQKVQTPDTLILPHPRVQDRAFVLVPMMDIAPDWVHPVLGLTVADMLDALPAAQRDEIKAL